MSYEKIAKELLEMGCSVDIICLEDYKSDNEKLRYFKAPVTLDYLRGFWLINITTEYLISYIRMFARIILRFICL